MKDIILYVGLEGKALLKKIFKKTLNKHYNPYEKIEPNIYQHKRSKNYAVRLYINKKYTSKTVQTLEEARELKRLKSFES